MMREVLLERAVEYGWVNGGCMVRVDDSISRQMAMIVCCQITELGVGAGWEEEGVVIRMGLMVMLNDGECCMLDARALSLSLSRCSSETTEPIRYRPRSALWRRLVKAVSCEQPTIETAFPKALLAYRGGGVN